ncbi:MAG: alpha-amylase family glycosyl hydrolase [Spirosomataceae bacterium]
MTRLFGNKITTNKVNGSMAENGVGKFNDIDDKALNALKKFGISHVWYTGVIEHATMEDFAMHGIKKDNPLVIKGRAGSPYAIKDYYDVNPFLASDVSKRMAEFEALVARTHANGMSVIIDCVPNHVAREYRSDVKPKGIKDFGEGDDTLAAFKPSNNFYYLPGTSFEVPAGFTPPVTPSAPYTESPAKATGNDVFSAKPSINDWFETIKLNYGVDYLDNRKGHFEPTPSTWLKMRDMLLFWAKKGVDGFRCDMAEMVPVEFWGWVIPEVKKVYPSVIFIAEIYNPQQYHNYILNGKFDYLYDKVGLYDGLRRLIENRSEATVEDITRVWQHESGDISAHMLRFLENHDEQRIASRFFANNPLLAIPAMALSATLHTGPLMIYFGQEVGVKAEGAEGFQGDDGRTTIFDFWGIPEFQAWVNDGKFDGAKLKNEQKQLRKFYEDLNKLVNSSDAIRFGGFYDLQYVNNNGQSTHYNGRKVYSYLRHSDKQKLLIVCNFDQTNGYETTIKIPTEAFSAMKLDANATYQFTDIFMQKTKVNTVSNGIVPIHLAPNSVYVFEIKPVSKKK